MVEGRPRWTDGLQREGLIAPPGRAAALSWATSHHGTNGTNLGGVSRAPATPPEPKNKVQGEGQVRSQTV